MGKEVEAIVLLIGKALQKPYDTGTHKTLSLLETRNSMDQGALLYMSPLAMERTICSHSSTLF